ncbi:unnamed protein product [Pedinophyceae sp. YPF-701]|nr:unnamed protein product [Pedinophyceae sp. YPF-701]
MFKSLAVLGLAAGMLVNGAMAQPAAAHQAESNFLVDGNPLAVGNVGVAVNVVKSTNGVTDYTQCSSTLDGTACPVMKYCDGCVADSVTYTVTDPTAAAGDTYTVKMCYAAASRVNKKWRKFKDDFGKDKSCTFKVKELSSTDLGVQQSYSMPAKLGNGFTYIIAVKKSAATGKNTEYGDMGAGYFKAETIDTVDDGLIAGVAVMSVFSVLLFIGFFTWEFLFKKKKN